MRHLFDYHGGTESDVAWACCFACSFDVQSWIESSDLLIVFLAKYANLPPAWVEQQDIARQTRLFGVLRQLLAAQSPKEPLEREPEPL